MERVSDTITSVFHIAMQNSRPVVCSGADRAIVWSEPFGLGYRFGISYALQGWFAKVHLYLDHAGPTHAEQDQAVVTIVLKDSTDKDAKEYKKRETTITSFGHAPHTSLGSWAPSDLSLYPYVSLTLTMKALLPQFITGPLPSASMALRKSLDSGDFADTRFYVFSIKGPGSTAGKPRVVYANRSSIGFALPDRMTGGKRVNVDGRSLPFLVNMSSDQHINDDSVLHEYEYEQDSDLDDEEDGGVARSSGPSKSRKASKSHTPTGSKSTDEDAHGEAEDEFSAQPPAYSVSNCQMVLVKGVAYKTWLAYIYFRYTGRVSFRPLRSAQGSSGGSANDLNQPLSCSPKSMYRLASTLGNERLKEIACHAIKEGLSKDNIIEEAFSWFTAQYPAIFEYEVEKVSELRKLPEISAAIRLQLKLVSLGEKPWAQHVLIAIMDKLNSSEPST